MLHSGNTGNPPLAIEWKQQVRFIENEAHLRIQLPSRADHLLLVERDNNSL